MKFFIICTLTLGFNLAALSQAWGDSTIKKGEIFYSVETPPKFPGGLNAYYRFLADNLESPKQSSGVLFRKTVQVKLFINKTGKVVFAEIEKGVDQIHNNAVLEIVAKMPNWSPALQNNRPVPVAISLPILFVD